MLRAARLLWACVYVFVRAYAPVYQFSRGFPRRGTESTAGTPVPRLQKMAAQPRACGSDTRRHNRPTSKRKIPRSPQHTPGFSRTLCQRN
ncbi:hypothetical protein AOLI_G00176340 [Acnodon oligacanthus]